MADSTNIRDFEKAVKAAVVELEKRDIPDFVRKVAFEAITNFVVLTPVDKATARHNWQVGVGAPPTSVLGEPVGASPDAVARDVQERALRVLSALPPYPQVYITNNAPHIEVLEYGEFEPPNPGPSKDPRPGREGRVLVSGGFSVQAPQGMVRITLLRFTGIIVRGTEELRRRRRLLGGGP